MEDQLKVQYGKIKSFNPNGDFEDRAGNEEKHVSPKNEKVAVQKKAVKEPAKD